MPYSGFYKVARWTTRYGIPVVPGLPGEKFSRFSGWPELATTDEAKLKAWNDDNELYNVIAVAKRGITVMIDIDDPSVIEKLPHALPSTLMVQTPSGGFHVYFIAAPESDALGNRNVLRIGDYMVPDAKGRPTCLLELKVHNVTVAAAGALNSDGISYKPIDLSPLCPIPIWLTDWIAKHAETKRTSYAPSSKLQYRKLHPDFEPEDFYEWYEKLGAFSIGRPVEKNGFEVDIPSCGCVFKGDFHEQSTETGFLRWNDGGFSWQCFADGCEGNDASIADVMDFLETEGFERYPYFIYEDEDDSLLFNDPAIPVEFVTSEPDDDAIQPPESSAVPVDTGSAESASPETVEVKKDPGYHFRSTDTGNAERLVRRFGGRIRYVRDAGEWRVWSGKAWLTDKTGRVDRTAKKVAQEIFEEAREIEDEDQRKAMRAWAVATESRERRSAMIDLAAKEHAVVTLIDDYDQDPWLFNVQNGTLDLKTGELLPHDSSNMMTKISQVNYDTEATCPLWNKFLARVQDNDQQMVDFLSRAVGYTLTGDAGIQGMFFLHGDGCNGKGVFTTVIRHLMGSYADNASFDTFVCQKNDGRIRNDLAKLVGARYVTASESQEGNRLDEALIKSLTGGDPITTRFLHKEFFTFYPQFKLWMSSNYKPAIRGLDWGIWRRVKMIPFEVIIPDEERDEQLTDKLKTELPGILNWALKGLADFLKFGMKYPDKVAAATQQYRESQDIIGQFLKAKCFLDPVVSVRVSDLYERYKTWAADAKEFILKERQFGDAMKKRGFEVDHKRDGNHYLGVARLPTEHMLDPADLE
jgi:P4 family phage/plasmid primase-like protien